MVPGCSLVRAWQHLSCIVKPNKSSSTVRRSRPVGGPGYYTCRSRSSRPPRLLNENFSRTYAELWNEEGIEMQNCQLKVKLHIITQPHQSRDNSNITISPSNLSSVFCIFLPSDPYTSQSNLGYLAGRLGCFATDHFFSLTELSAEPTERCGTCVLFPTRQ